MPSASFITEMNRKQGSQPVVKLEFIDKANNVTDISRYYVSGANFEFSRERAPDVIQAGNFDVVVINSDNTFSEFDPSSLFYNLDYTLAKIRISLGFVLSTGLIEYETQAVGYIDQITTNPIESTVTLRCRDIMRRILDSVLRNRPENEIPILGTSSGNGFMSKVSTLPFSTVNEDWTVTCTTGGVDSVAQFSVVGTVSGSIGPATSGIDFSDTTAGIKFKISSGSIAWDIGDVFTFSTNQAPEWDTINAVKIIWSILTGYNWDSDTQEPFSSLVLNFDRTQSSANVDIDYDSFVSTISGIDELGEALKLKGYIDYESSASGFIEGILVLFFGSLFTGSDGRIKIQTHLPIFGGTALDGSFSDADKISALGYSKTIDEVINFVTVAYKNSDIWGFSDESQPLDGAYSFSDSASITKYGKLLYSLTTDWFVPNGIHIKGVGSTLIQKFSEPPLNIEFQTGLDALLMNVGDYVDVTDTKYYLSDVKGEIVQVSRSFDNEPKSVSIRIRRDNDIDLLWGFLGSNVDEGDGESPQSSNWDTATELDKRFIYLSQTGGGGPDYRMY